MTTVLITGIGGSIGVDVCRSLRRDPRLRLVGADCSEWGRRLGRRLCHEVITAPSARDGAETLVDGLSRIIRDAQADFVFVNPDPELEAVAAAGWSPDCWHALPSPGVMAACLDKGATVRFAQSEASDFPATFVLQDAAQMDEPFARLGSPLWLRATVGPGGLGSIVVESPDEAAFWIRYWNKPSRGGVGQWMFQEYLPGRNFNWTGLFVDGRLVVSAAMERLRYFLGGAAVSGVSGQVSLCSTVSPERLREVSERVIRRVDERPHGLYSVDLREDEQGKPRVTEINPRLAGRPWLYSNSGVNLPLAAVRTAMGEELGDAVQPGGLVEGVHLSRQLDVEPVIGFPAHATEGNGQAELIGLEMTSHPALV